MYDRGAGVYLLRRHMPVSHPLKRYAVHNSSHHHVWPPLDTHPCTFMPVVVKPFHLRVEVDGVIFRRKKAKRETRTPQFRGRTGRCLVAYAARRRRFRTVPQVSFNARRDHMPRRRPTYWHVSRSPLHLIITDIPMNEHWAQCSPGQLQP